MSDHLTPDSPPRRGRTAVVSGGGPGGAATALLLAAVGFDVTVLERQAAPADVGGALLIQPNGLAVLQALGLTDALAACHHPATSTIRDGRGRTLIEAPVHRAGPGLERNVVVRRSHLFGLLLDRAADHPRIDLRLGTAARSVDDDGVVAVSSGATETLAADLVIAADGVRSALRPSIDPTAEVVEGPVYVRAVVAGTLPDGMEGEWWTGLGLFGAAAVGDGAMYVFSSSGHPDLAAALDARDLDAFAARWADELPVAADLLSRASGFDRLMVNRADEVRASRWVDGRAALLGDAAHAMVPNSGQGANSAFVDAAVLAIELASAPSISAGLAAYEARRKPAVTVAQADARRLARLGHLTSGPARVGRDLLLRAAARLPSGRQARRLYQEDPMGLRDACAAVVAADQVRGR
jgi:2-polyprenyl-6-methoxyphenol hydroxylase-like FAD-dependent oxidoreductase